MEKLPLFPLSIYANIRKSYQKFRDVLTQNWPWSMNYSSKSSTAAQAWRGTTASNNSDDLKVFRKELNGMN